MAMVVGMVMAESQHDPMAGVAMAAAVAVAVMAAAAMAGVVVAGVVVADIIDPIGLRPD